MNNMNFFNNIKWGRPSVTQIIFIVVGLLLAVGAFFFARGLVTCWTLTALPGVAPSNCGTVTAGLSGPDLTNTGGTPVPTVEGLPPPIIAPDSDLPPAWLAKGRRVLIR